MKFLKRILKKMGFDLQVLIEQIDDVTVYQ